MSDDSFFREVDEELRSDRMQEIWKRYGKVIIGIAVAVVVLTAAYRGYIYYKTQQAQAAGDVFITASHLLEEGKSEEGTKMLEELVATGSDQYPFLADMRIAAQLVRDGKFEEAATRYKAVVEGSTELQFKDVARIRGGYAYLDAEKYDQASAMVATLSKTGEPYRHNAREVLGLAAWKSGDMKAAEDFFLSIIEDEGANTSIKQRSEIMLDLIAAAKENS
jgi:hypothetical protein